MGGARTLLQVLLLGHHLCKEVCQGSAARSWEKLNLPSPQGPWSLVG